MQSFFESLLPSGYVAQRELCKAFLQLMDKIPLCRCGCDKTMKNKTSETDHYHWPFEFVMQQFLLYAVYMWKIRSDPQVDLLREAERIVLHRPEQWRRSKPTAFIGLAVQSGLTEYVRLRIEESPSLLRARSKPLLHYAITTMSAPYERDSGREFEVEPNVRLDMIELLLRLGAPIERRVWKPLILTIHENQVNSVSRRDLVTALARLVESGANLDESVVIGSEYERAKETERRQI
jgi:hypothetical protein